MSAQNGSVSGDTLPIFSEDQQEAQGDQKLFVRPLPEQEELPLSAF